MIMLSKLVRKLSGYIFFETDVCEGNRAGYYLIYSQVRANKSINNKVNLKTKRGATMVEFALVAPVFLALMFGTIQISFALLKQSIFVTAVAQATSQANLQDLNTDDTITLIKNIIAKNAYGFLDIQKVQVEILTDSVNDPANSLTNSTANLNRYRITYS